MNRNLIFGALILVLGLVSIGAYKLVSNWMLAKEEAEQRVAGSDAKVNTTLRGGGDSFIGYAPTVSPEMKRQLARRGLGLNFTDDGGAYEERLAKFAAGEYDFITLPAKEYIQHGLKHNYPGVICAVISDSTGADVILGVDKKLPSGKVNDLNDASLKFVYTEASPSEFLIDLTVVDFDLYNLTRTDAWRDPCASIDDVVEKARRGEGDVFAVWEPEASRLLREVPGLKKIWGSDKFRGYIVDVFVFRRDFLTHNHDDVVSFFEAYYSTMRTYASDRAKFIDDLSTVTGLRPDAVEPLIGTLDWQDLSENCLKQFGIGNNSAEGILNTIDACTAVLVKTGRLKSDPLTDPYRIINTSVLKAVQTRLPSQLGQATGKRQFSSLTAADWDKLEEIGLMRVEPISFQTGNSTLDTSGEMQVDKIAEALANNYPDMRVVVKGHTSKGTDEKESVKLSQERADAVVQRLVAVHGMSENRFKAVGIGSAEPPEKRPGENPRAYMYRIPRVEFILYMDNAF